MDSGLREAKIQTLTSEQKAKALVRLGEYQKSPELFFREVLGIEGLWDKQLDILDAISKHKRVCVASGHDLGKSYAAGGLALWFLYCFPPAIVITTAPTWRQVEKVLWGEIANHYAKARVHLGGKLLETEIKLGPKWYAIGFSSDKRDSFQGFHEKNVFVIMDEPSGVPDEIDEQIQSILSNENARYLKIGNPIRDLGHFAESYKSKIYFPIHMSCLDSPNVKAGKVIYPGLVTKEWCDERKEEWGEDSAVYQSRVLGLFPKEAEDTLIKLGWIEAGILRHEQFKNQKLLGNTVISLDVARFGNCKTVFIVRTGRRVREVVAYRGFDLMHTVGVARRLIGEYKPDEFNIDDNGLGGGVTDRLRELNYKNINPINASETASDPSRYSNRKSEMAWRVREAFRQNGLDMPDVEALVFQCNNQYYDMDSNGRIRVMSKSLLKKKGLDSPDYFEALSLSYANEVPEALAKETLQFSLEFDDKVHVLDISEDKAIGVSRFNVMAPMPDGRTALLWAAADKNGLIHVYREALIERTTSSAIDKAILSAEGARPADSRLAPKIYRGTLEHEYRYNLFEQLEDYGYDFDEIEFIPELVLANIREGLAFDKKLPVNNRNHPHIFFHPSCHRTIRAVKYSLITVAGQKNPEHDCFNLALGLLVLAEPKWLKAGHYA